MIRYGASFSARTAEHLGLEPKPCLKSALTDLGVKRLRLMSYWDRLEPVKGSYDFSELDWQIDMAEKHGVEVTLCLGLRQPRWPESHWPDWARELPVEDWQKALRDFMSVVILRYKQRDCIVSYQLENEAFNRSFGEHGEFSRRRLKREMKLIKQLDPHRPVIMSTSNTYGLPLFGPRPDIYGFSIYRHFYQKGSYRHSRLQPGFFRLRAVLIRVLQWRWVYIHELQAEPWGPKPVQDMSIKEQYKSISPLRVQEAVKFADATRLYPIDLWGLEWWYWLKTKHDKTEIWEYLRTLYKGP